MGRKKLQIKRISNDKIRCITYSKRKIGLLKKAAELALLCQAKVTILLQDQFENLTEFRSNVSPPKPKEKVSFHQQFTIEHYPSFHNPTIASNYPLNEEEATDRPASNSKELEDLKIATEPEIQPSEQILPTWLYIPGTPYGCLYYPTHQQTPQNKEAEQKTL